MTCDRSIWGRIPFWAGGSHEFGPQMGVVAPRPRYKCSLAAASVAGRVLRRAEDIDIRQEELNIRKEREYAQAYQKKIAEHHLPMKLIDVEIVPDGSKIIFLFTGTNHMTNFLATVTGQNRQVSQ